MRLRRLAVLATVVVAAPLATITAQGGADADTTCKVNGPHDAGLYTRSCKIYSSRIGGLVQGSVFWDYKQPGIARGDSGQGTLQLNDRTADGKCTRVKIKYRGSDPSETVVRKACGGAKYGPFNFTLNMGDHGFGVHLDGRYIIEHCNGHDPSTCIVLWRQKVGQNPPS